MESIDRSYFNTSLQFFKSILRGYNLRVLHVIVTFAGLADHFGTANGRARDFSFSLNYFVARKKRENSVTTEVQLILKIS